MEVPTRYSVDQWNFDPAIGRRLKICLDGVQQSRVLEYDITRKFLVRYQTDENGKLLLSDDRENVITERLTGEVTVDLLD